MSRLMRSQLFMASVRSHLGSAASILAALIFSAAAQAQPANNACGNAITITAGTPVVGTAQGATADGNSLCNLEPTGDVYYRFVTPVAGTYTFTLCSGTSWDTVISLHTGCPADGSTEIACDDDGCVPAGSNAFGLPSSLTASLPAGQTYIIRVAGFDLDAALGLFTLNVVGPAAASGACCLNGSCSLQSPTVCAAAGANFRGAWTACIVPAGNQASYPGPAGPLAIPDNTPLSGGIQSTINVPDSFTVGDVQLELTLAHPFVGDLQATLTHSATSVTLMERIGGGSAGDDSDFGGIYIFSDSGFDTIWQAAVDSAPNSDSVVPNAPHRAADKYANTVSLRAAFTGQSSAGAWTLRLADGGFLDTGTLFSWRLLLDRAGGDPCDLSGGACCDGSSCRVVTQAQCAGVNRDFRGAGTICNAPGDFRSPCCKADYNHVDGITVQDIFDFLVAFFLAQPGADINGGGLSVQDLFDFLVGYFAGCT